MMTSILATLATLVWEFYRNVCGWDELTPAG
jgi:hypothetical protein